MRASHDAMSSPLQLCLLLGIPNRVLPRLLSLLIDNRISLLAWNIMIDYSIFGIILKKVRR